MNQKDTYQITINKGDMLAVDYAIDHGRFDVTIEKSDGEVIYRGDDIHSSIFWLPIEESGTYRINVHARYAEGYFKINVS